MQIPFELARIVGGDHVNVLGQRGECLQLRRHRFSEWSSRIRPAWVRQKSYAIQRRLRPMADEHGGIFSDDYLGRVIDLGYPAMRRFFRMESITDSSVWRRIACECGRPDKCKREGDGAGKQ